MCSMFSSRPSEAPISEPLPCPACDETAVVRTQEDCQLEDGLAVKALEHFKCSTCGARFFDDVAIHRVQAERARQSLAHAS